MSRCRELAGHRRGREARLARQIYDQSLEYPQASSRSATDSRKLHPVKELGRSVSTPQHVQQADDIAVLLAVLPPAVGETLARHPDLESLLEVVLDLGRTPEARFPDGTVWLGDEVVTRDTRHATRAWRLHGRNRAVSSGRAPDLGAAQPRGRQSSPHVPGRVRPRTIGSCGTFRIGPHAPPRSPASSDTTLLGGVSRPRDGSAALHRVAPLTRSPSTATPATPIGRRDACRSPRRIATRRDDRRSRPHPESSCRLDRHRIRAAAAPDRGARVQLVATAQGHSPRT